MTDATWPTWATMRALMRATYKFGWDVIGYARALRDRGVSLRDIAAEIKKTTNETVSPETVRAWLEQGNS